MARRKLGQTDGEQPEVQVEEAVQPTLVRPVWVQPAWVPPAAKKDKPKVSCILSTRDRPEMFAEAVKCFESQTYLDKELVVVDSGVQAVVVPYYALHCKLEPGTPLGAALNAAATLATGDVLQKMDDDDWYGPQFIEASVASLARPVAQISGWRHHLVSIGGVLRVMYGLAGGTIAIMKPTWNEVRFREIASRVDLGIWQDVQAAKGLEAAVYVADKPDAYIYVRHGGNLWQTVTCYTHRGSIESPVDLFLGRLPVWRGNDPRKGARKEVLYGTATAG